MVEKIGKYVKCHVLSLLGESNNKFKSSLKLENTQYKSKKRKEQRVDMGGSDNFISIFCTKGFKRKDKTRYFIKVLFLKILINSYKSFF